jgi:hypothetical protein
MKGVIWRVLLICGVIAHTGSGDEGSAPGGAMVCSRRTSRFDVAAARDA